MRVFIGVVALPAVGGLTLFAYYLRGVWRLARGVAQNPRLQEAGRTVREADENWRRLKQQIESYHAALSPLNTYEEDNRFTALKARYAQAVLDKAEANKQYQDALQGVKT